MDSEGNLRAALVLTQAGEPGLKLYDHAGVVRAALVVANDGRTSLALYDAANKDLAALATNPAGTPVLIDGDGHPLTRLPVLNDESPPARPRVLRLAAQSGSIHRGSNCAPQLPHRAGGLSLQQGPTMRASLTHPLHKSIGAQTQSSHCGLIDHCRRNLAPAYPRSV
jgi:hypothetical protein